MAGNIKGLKVEIGGDTTELGKALEDVNGKSKSLSSELGQINRLLKMDPGNADLLAQKQTVLAEAVDNTRKKLDTLKEAEKQVQAQFEKGEASAEQVRALKREIEATEQKLGSYEGAAKQTADEIDNLGEQSRAAKNASEGLGDTLSDVASKGLATLAAGCTAVIGSLVAAAESTREYREAMGKLDTAFADSGFSADAANSAYTDLVGILGETDQSVEAANHLAKLTDNEKDLATWTGDILPGIFATFGDSLPIEGLTEAANETAKVGTLTGGLADALNWAGVNEEEFQAQLDACSTEQERQTLIMETLNSLYGDASAAYKETNADVIAANEANAAWMESMAQVGAAVEPLITQVKTMGAELLEKAVPAIEGLINNLPTVAVAVAGITAALVSYKVASLAATAAEKGMTLAQYAAAAAQKALNVAMAANPIGIIILAITGLVAAFVYLWNNSEKFREFWINLWEKIKEAVSKAVEFFKTAPQKIYNAILGAVDKVKTWGTNLVNQAKTAATNFLNNVTNTLKNIPGKVTSSISGAIQNVATWGTNLVNRAKTAATNFLNGVANTLRNIPSRVTSSISGAIQNVATWGSNMVTKAKTAAQNLITGVTSTLSSLPGQVLSIGSNIVTGLWNGISNKFSWLTSKISGFASSVLGSIKSFFGVHSPSTETAWVGDMLDQGLAQGLLDNAKDPVKAMEKVSAGVLGATGTVDGLSLERSLQTSAVATASQAASGGGISAKLDKILTAIEKGQVLMLDGDTLVGSTVDRYDAAMGQRRLLAARGAV